MMTLQGPRITVVTVSFNAKEGIERTILSVINQTYTNVEYIIIDGGSTDGTVDVVKKHEPRISYWVSESDKGIYDAMNKGIKKATGEWLIMLNAGDIFSDNQVLEKIFSKDIPSNISFLYSNYYSRRPNGQRILRSTSFEEGNVLHQAIIYRRNLHQEHGLYIVTKDIIISDYLFFIRIPQEEVMKIDTVISEYEGGGLSSNGDWTRKQAICADVVFRRRTFGGMIWYYIWRMVKSIIPIDVKDNIKLFLGIK